MLLSHNGVSIYLRWFSVIFNFIPALFSSTVHQQVVHLDGCETQIFCAISAPHTVAWWCVEKARVYATGSPLLTRAAHYLAVVYVSSGVSQSFLPIIIICLPMPTTTSLTFSLTAFLLAVRVRTYVFARVCLCEPFWTREHNVCLCYTLVLFFFRVSLVHV